VLLVTKRSAYETYAEDLRDPRFLALVRAEDPKARALLASHREHYLTVETVEKALDRLGVCVDRLQRGEPFNDSAYDLVVAVGGDGTFISAAHNIRTTPILGVNSSPADSVGFFCGPARKTADSVLEQVGLGRIPVTALYRLRTEIEGAQVPQPALNEVLYAHEHPAAMARYRLKVRREREEQKSSGVWIGPPAGSRAALGSAGGRRLPLLARKFQFVVREPYRERGRRCRLRSGVLGPKGVIEIESHLGHGKLFIDGPYVSYGVPFGGRVTMRLDERPLLVLDFRDPDRAAAGGRRRGQALSRKA
jgi:NAD+ kinase